VDSLGIYHPSVSFGVEFEMLLDDLWGDRDDVLAFPILDQVQRLKRADDVLRLDGGHLAHILDGDVAAMLAQDLQQHLRPITAEAQQTQIGQGLFRRPHLAFLLGQFVREGDEKLPVTFALERRQGKNAGQVVLVGRILLFREVADHVETATVALGHDVEQEGLHVVIQSFVIQKELRHQAQILAIYLVPLSVHLEHGKRSAAVDLVAGGMAEVAFQLVPLQRLFLLHIFETKFANKEFITFSEFFRIWGEIPGINFMFAQFYTLNIFYFCYFFMFFFKLR